MMNNFIKSRIDYILIWGHGIKYINDILMCIRKNKGFKILKIVKYKPENMKRFVKEVYSFDYAPFWHLKAKTKYLIKTFNHKEVCFVFIENLSPNEDYLGEGKFRHKESIKLKKIKEELRNKYNPYKNGERTENHIIHASDSPEQTDNILKYLGYKDGIKLFENENKFIVMPYYIKGYKNFEFKTININNLFCNVIYGDSWNHFSLKTVPVKKSPQYRGLSENICIYKNYLNKYLGGPLQEDYNSERYKSIYENFEYLKEPYQNHFVIVKKNKRKYVILDGVHRASIHIYQGNNEIKVCQIK